ncbi:MAG TPA: Rpn family recombination-promoting nuclease/putative transposase [Gordonia sp. (in: high G+C Gram-positive bacteria)]|mgnify:CR=1 FL=1|uniref:Rpn family recombination-promoting nuclease/putative transposase n=1 Tax=unclassified Gordonia (in: high G+C Gram-positive bacteria) TaxID=2657482 RepID=UPI000FAFF791|nr:MULTISPECIES: Rpn family recombination-promoting nuclease/putative transposase [unclassified Gordonia (in: high G+C Gram-positive bacteria)]RUP41236.1 MAG: Rpn family recombination-promoting nuclease/putative transposase [Gordonia sp. (in: high G+C Gram-positive bacteria)]HNP55566.1 Rpn family recombination-promoting nuclease/putative transposase [Gordonia sp. (in: high G+C Gram-positive bacteria)]HRC52644.1 Rpn family recombination-promoting nuclease/putative transposase [Gordonia sp. (in: h
MDTGGPKQIQPHDALIRAVLSNPDDAGSVLRSFLPATVLDGLDLEHLELQSGTFITEELSARNADLLLRTTIRGEQPDGTTEEHDAYLYFLVEHQSTPEPAMAVRMNGYQQLIWERHLLQHPNGPIPLVIPIVIYQGQRRWDAPTNVADLLDLPAAYAASLGEDLPRIRYYLIDLTGLDDDDLRNRPLTQTAQLTFVSLRRGPGDDDVTLWLTHWRPEIDGLSKQILTMLIRYLGYVGNTPRDKLAAFAATTGPHTEEIIMTAAGRLVTEAEARGEAKGRAEGEARLLLKQLSTRYGTLDPEIHQRVENATTEQIELWSIRLIQGNPELDDIFA